MWQISAGLTVALVVTSGAFKLYYDKSEAEKETIAMQLRQSADNQVLLENSIASLNTQVLQVEEDKIKAFEQISMLQEQNQEAQAEVSKLKSKFDKHNMNVLSLRKPKLIENIINRGTREVLNELEAITSPATNNM
jgi:chromosome segregation ATPase|tara:strand:+ start:339 stop:746 length:408 start_codon:yes stop_codon:yes gene_type:complete